MTALYNYYSGDYNAFVDSLAVSKMSMRQAAVVSRCWSKITGSGTSADSAPAANFVAAFKDEEKAKSVLAALNTTEGGAINWADFLTYYKQIAVLIPEDNYFEEFIEGQYKEKFAATADKLNKEHVMHLLALMRQRLITLAGSSQEEYALRNMFRSFDVDNSGTITMGELSGLVAKLGVYCLDGELEAMFRELDTNQNGTLEFEEFQALMISDPYTKYNLIKE